MAKLYYKVSVLYVKIVTKYVYLWCTINQIPIGKGCKFWGRTFLRKSKYGIIQIGSHNRFRSLATSNWIGINRPCMISTQGNEKALISIGDECGFSGTVIAAFKEIKIGNHVLCGANTLITDSDWHNDDPRTSPPKAVIIHDNVWLGVNSIVLKGVTIGSNSIIGANSVVTTDIPANVVAAGNPCKVIKSL